jgi:dihydrofolate reductase
LTISLDGFISDRNGSVDRLYPDFAELRDYAPVREAMARTGAVVMGRHAYDMGNGDFTDYEFQVPIFVVTHHPPEQAARGENDRLRFTFVTDGVESAVARAKAVAGDRDVTVIGGAGIAQQLLTARCVDELEISIMPVLLGGGLRLFDNLGPAPISLEKCGVTESALRTDLRFRVLR